MLELELQITIIRMSAWGAPQGAWANQVDEEEAENGGELDPVPGVSTAFPALGDTSFPSLGEAITAKDTKRDRKQKGGPQKMSLGSFMAAPEKVVLPTGPRERAEGEEERRGLGGGFKTYGGDRGTLCTVLHSIDCEPGVQGLIQGSEMDTSISRHLRVAIVAQYDVHDVAVSP